MSRCTYAVSVRPTELITSPPTQACDHIEPYDSSVRTGQSSTRSITVATTSSGSGSRA